MRGPTVGKVADPSAGRPASKMPAPSVNLLCTVRGCGRELVRGAGVLRCAHGHSFDVARSGYVNLLQPGDRRSLQAGDTRAAVEARDRLEQRGHADELVAAFEEETRALTLARGAPVLEVGACTGFLLERLVATFALEGWALELSTAAARLGARRRSGLAWVTANADRHLPFADAAFALLVSARAPKNPAEFRRVLAPGGALLVAVPAPDDLLELRALLLGEGRHIDRTPGALELFTPLFTCRRRRRVERRATLDRSALEDLLASAYRGARTRERQALEGVETLEVTLSSDLLCLV